MYIDSTPYGFSFDRSVSDGNVRAAGISYKWLSGIALALCAGISLLSGWLGVMIQHNSSGRMACGTTVHSLQFEVGLWLFALHLSLGFSHGKRNDALVEASIKARRDAQELTWARLRAAAEAFDDDRHRHLNAADDVRGYTPDFGGGSLRQDN